MKPRLSRFACACLVVLAAASACAAQTGGAPAPSASGERRAGPTTDADQDFELNIAERRITERRLEASTAAALGDESVRGLDLRVGVMLGAEEIDVLLRNVRGHVRFHANLDAVLRRLRRVEPPAAPRAAPGSPSP